MNLVKLRENLIKLVLSVAIILSQSNFMTIIAFANIADESIEETLRMDNEIYSEEFLNEIGEISVENLEEDFLNKESDENEAITSEEINLEEAELIFIEENEINELILEENIEGRELSELAMSTGVNNRGVGSGLVQFELALVGNLPAGVNATQMRHALMNVTTMTHSLSRTPGGAVATAVNGAFGRDALFLEETNDHYRILIAGFEGWVPKNGTTQNVTVSIGGQNHTVQARAVAVFYPFGSYASGVTAFTAPTNLQTLEFADQKIPFVADMVPFANTAEEVASVSHYVNRNGILWRVLTGNVASPTHTAQFIVGPAPTWMTQNTNFYSFDGVFFYRNPRNIRLNGQGAENENNPHFNYFQYLSFRSQSQVSATDLNNFIWNQLSAADRQTSVMINSGQYFINAQATYGTNAILQFAKGILESNRGLSSIARNNNNLFGLNAIDSNPGGNASQFPTVSASISEHANHWLSRGYLNPGDWRHAGPHVGHKGSGINVRYATDPYWGAKIAGWAFRIDQASGGRDLNNYTIGVLQNNVSLPVTNANNVQLYVANTGGFRYFPFLVLDRNARRIRTDAPVVGNNINHQAIFNRSTAIGYISGAASLVFSGGTNGQQPLPTPPEAILPEDNNNNNNNDNNNNDNNDNSTGGVREGQTTARLNLRSGPGTNHGIIRTLPTGQALTILSESNGWMRVRVGNEEGFVSSEFVRVNNSGETAPAPAPSQEVHQGQTTARLNLRAGAGTNHRVIRTLPTGQSLTILSESNGWMRVRVGNEEGFVSAEWVRVMNGGGATTPAPTPTPTPTDRQGQTTARLNLRAGAGTNHRVIRTLSTGQNLTILSESNGWMRVRVGNEEGFVSAEWIRIVNGGGTTPTNRQGQTTTRLNLRAGAGTNHRVIRTLPTGQNLTILSESNGWMRVRVGNEEGFVSSEWVRNL